LFGNPFLLRRFGFLQILESVTTAIAFKTNKKCTFKKFFFNIAIKKDIIDLKTATIALKFRKISL